MMIELVLEEVYIMSLHFYLQELSEITTKKIALEVKLVCAGAVLRMANDKDILCQDYVVTVQWCS